MKIMQASEISRSDHWKMVIYAKPGTGKTTLVRYLKGKTLVVDLDNSSRVLAGLENVSVISFNRTKPNEEMNSLLSEIDKIVADGEFDNVIIDNISSFEKDWFTEKARNSKSHLNNQLQDYSAWTNYFSRVMAKIYAIKNVNILVTAWETTREVTSLAGQTFNQYAPQIRLSVMDGLLGLSDVVGRLVINPKDDQRGVILQGDDGIFAKNRIDGRKTCLAKELFSNKNEVNE
jgi:phage nucleotide-binding protein